MRSSLTICLLGVAIVTGTPAVLAQSAPFLAPIGFESQLRAQTGFPRIDESALQAYFHIDGGYHDAAANRYVWTLRPRGDERPSFKADFVDDAGVRLQSAGLIYAQSHALSVEASVEVPPAEVLYDIERMVIRPADADSP